MKQTKGEATVKKRGKRERECVCVLACVVKENSVWEFLLLLLLLLFNNSLV
jgi:hypothetical protein